MIKYTLIFACIILWSCEKEKVEDPNNIVAKPVNTKYLNAEELPAEFQYYFIQKNSNSSAKSNDNENDLSNAIFTEYDIVSMTDDKNITNYSISFFYPDTPENIFYNLVINVLPTGENSRYIFKYICNPADFQNFKSHNFDFKYFVGMTEISLAPASSNGTLTSKMNTGDEDCPKIYIPSSSDLGSNPGAAGGGGGSSSSGGFNTSVPGYNAPGHTGGSSLGPSTGGSGGHDHSGCYGSRGQYWYSAGDVRPPHSHNEKKATDCPDLFPPPGNVPVLPMPMIKVLGKELALSFDQIVFLRDKPDLMNAINQHLEENNFSEESKNFAIWSINYLMQNPNVTINQFKNWFMGTSEGQDGDYDAAYWENPNLTFPQQSLPTFNDFKNAYPKNSNGTFEMNYADVYNLVGGTPKAMRDGVLTDTDPLNDHNYDNACALRTSRALNYSGIIIPYIKNQTFKGSDNKYYFLGARNLYKWMIKTFPTNNTNSIVLHQSDGGPNGTNFPSLLGLNQGIYILIPKDASKNSGFAASGHAGIYTTPELTHYYFGATGGVESITLWKLN